MHNSQEWNCPGTHELKRQEALLERGTQAEGRVRNPGGLLHPRLHGLGLYGDGVSFQASLATRLTQGPSWWPGNAQQEGPQRDGF